MSTNVDPSVLAITGAYMLMANTDYHDWRKKNSSRLKGLAPTVSAHIDTGINPIDLIVDPVLDTSIKVARKAVTRDAVVFNTLTPEEVNLPLIATGGPPANLLANYEDTKFYYHTKRNAGFEGEGGRSKYDSQIKSNELRRSNYYLKERPLAFAFLESRIDPTIRNKIEIPYNDYILVRNSNDYMALLQKAELCVLGGGVRAVGQHLIRLTQTTMKSCGNNYLLFFKMFNEASARFMTATQAMPAHTDFRLILFNVLHTFQLAQSEHPLIRHKMTINLSNNLFMDVTTLQAEIMDANSHIDGIIGLAGEEQGVLYNANVAKKSPPRRFPPAIICFNCRGNHRVGDCHHPLNTCRFCGKVGHCDKMHEEATAANKRREEKLNKPSYSKKNPAYNSPAAMLARKQQKSVKKPPFRILPRPNSLTAHNAQLPIQ